MNSEILSDTKDKMAKAVAHFSDEIKGLRSGRATPALVENIRVEYYGSPTPLKQIASIAIPEPRALVIKPFDVSAIKDIERAIQTSEIGINPQSDGKVLRLVVPDMSEEQRKKLSARLKDIAEQTRIALRNIRRDQNKHADDAGMPEDDVTKCKDEVQKLLKGFETQVDSITKEKTTEIMDT